MKKLLFLLPLFLISFSFNTQAQKNKKQAPATEAYDNSLLETMKWRLVGPFRGGRAGTVAGVVGNDNLYYMGTAGGGVWKTEDAGSTWECISDGYYGGSIGALTVAESDPNVLYVGEGEQTVRGNVSSGWGLWRSTDAGATWNHIGLDETEHIGRIRVHPTDPDLVYVAAMGNLWKPNKQRGVFRSKDGGKTWENILFESDKAGAVDIILDPNNPRIIYASMWQIKRNGYRMDSGGPGSKIWKSVDGGDTWENISERPGLPKGVWGISGVTVSPVNSDRIWVIIEADDGGVFRSDDAGKTWQKVNQSRALRQRAWYYSRIYADTENEDMVYVLNVSYHRSKDGGKTFESFRAPHGDHHDLWIDPNNNQRMAMADDGGVQVSNDGGANWSTYHNQPTAQFYRVTVDNHFPYRILGAQQDNSTVRILHRAPGSSITEADWENTAGGESAHLAPDPDDPNIVYGGTYKGYMMRKDHNTGQTRSTNVWPFNPAGSGAEVMKYRFNWNYPIFFSPHDSDKLYAGSNHLHVSYNEGQSWETISPDLTRNDPKTILSSGGPITQDNTGVEFYATIFAAEESELEEGVIWVGSDDGLIHVTKDGGKSWDNVTPPMAPDNIMMNCIDVHPFKEGGVYIAGTSYKFGDYTPYLFKSMDYGKTWKTITSGIDKKHYTRAIRSDLAREGLLYAGTEWGMYVSFDDGDNWQPFQMNLPIVAIRDLIVKEEQLIAATHGRSFWMIDDLNPVRELNDEIADKGHHLFTPKPSYRISQSGRWGEGNSKLYGQNHPNGVLFQFHINELEEDDEVKLEIKETDGTVIKTLSSKVKKRGDKLNAKKGGNRAVWDMRYEGFKEFPGMVLYSSPNLGPKAVPGKYVATLSINGEESTTEFEIKKDPRMPNTSEDYQKQFDFLIATRDQVSAAHQAILDIRKTKEDLKFIKSKIDDSEKQKDLVDVINTLEKDITEIENTIHQTKNRARQDALNYGIKLNNHLAFLMQDQQRGDYPPTDQAVQLKDELTEKLKGVLSNLDQTMTKGLIEIETKMKEAGISILGSVSRKS